MGDLDEIPSILHNLGYIALHQGDCLHAMDLFKEGLAIQRQTGNCAGIAECLLGIAGVLAVQGQAERGARLFGSAEALRLSVSASLWPANRIEIEFTLSYLRESLNENILAALLTQGQSIPVEQIITE